MKNRPLLLVLLAVLLASFIILGSLLNPFGSRGNTTTVEKGPLAVWSVYEGKLEARRVILVMSKFQGSATVIELAPEGASVSKGDVLVRFDSSALEREVLKLEREYTLAETELESLKNAQMPLELRDLEIELMKARSSLNAEKEYLEASLPLVEEDLVSEQEIEQQKLKIAEAKTRLETLELQLQLTKKYLHPSALKRAQVKLASAEQELEFAREQIQNSIVRASADGKVVYIPLYIGTEFRTIRVGDSVYPNQPFMALPDMSEFAVHCQVPEVELSRVQVGNDTYIQPLAFSGMRLSGQVESVSSMAQNPPGRPSWQRFFHVVISLKDKDFDPRLRPGMSVTTHILSYHNPEAVLIPRTAVGWESGKPFVKVVSGSSQERRLIKLGMADEKTFEVIEGLKPGEEILSR
jgi:HlyD family secretion protein